MSRTSRNRVLVAVALGVLAATGVGAYAAAENASVSDSSAVRKLLAERRPGQFARSYGLNPADALLVFTLRDGLSVFVVGNTTAKCLIRSDSSQSGETCDTVPAIDQGQAISVLDECGSSGSNRMEITGLAPEGVTSARLIWSDGIHEDTWVTHGAFKLEGTNPSAGAPYPTAIAWIQRGGETGRAIFPVHGDQFCLPAR